MYLASKTLNQLPSLARRFKVTGINSPNNPQLTRRIGSVVSRPRQTDSDNDLDDLRQKHREKSAAAAERALGVLDANVHPGNSEAEGKRVLVNTEEVRTSVSSGPQVLHTTLSGNNPTEDHHRVPGPRRVPSR